MYWGFETWLVLAVFLIFLNVNIIFLIIIRKLKGKSIDKVLASFSDYYRIKQYVQLEDDLKKEYAKGINFPKWERKSIRKLHSRFKLWRIEGAINLGVISTDSARLALEDRLKVENNHTVKLYIANSLTDIGDESSLPILVGSLLGEYRFYRNRVNMLISGFGYKFNDYLDRIIDVKSIEYRELIVDFSTVYYSDRLKDYLIALIAELDEGDMVNKAVDVLSKFYPEVLDDSKYLNSSNQEIRKAAIRALSNYSAPDRIGRLIKYLGDVSVSETAIEAILKLISHNSGYIGYVLRSFKTEENEDIKRSLADIFSDKIEYFIMKLMKEETGESRGIIKEVLLMGKTSDTINFLNRNKDLDLENEVCSIMREVIGVMTVKADCLRYLNPRLLKKCGILLNKGDYEDKKLPNKPKTNNQLVFILFCSMLIVPLFFVIRRFSELWVQPPVQLLKIFVIDFNYYLAFYAATVSFIYFLLLFFSYVNSRRQLKLWNFKSMTLLFKNGILPNVSIIAPAFNEEMTILESVNSLLNLKYPDYELVVVNDGSIDNTLDILIGYFNLKRVDYKYDMKIPTKEVQGVYMNRALPKLIVVDKVNGGKADALNVGINVSKKEYFCGIDADSMLENDALLKLTSQIIDENVETPALGGNIFPINGCTVRKGQIERISIPKNNLAKFQMIEYIRAFMSGRLGWAYLNNLLIVSGAFGLFRKERVISVGGYLTSSGKFKRDTIGEDMEIVVRINRLMRELKLKYKICYAFNANCWTEVPEDIGTLRRQRYRWHKGLIDILLYHRRMLFNPKYGSTGLLAMPYFFIFEMIGPIFEAQGYLMVVLAFFLGLLNVQIALMFFVTSVLLGMFISLASFVISEKHNSVFTIRELIKLIFFALVENLGPRQLFSIWRVGGFLGMMKNSQKWDKSKRKGFTTNERPIPEGSN